LDLLNHIAPVPEKNMGGRCGDCGWLLFFTGQDQGKDTEKKYRTFHSKMILVFQNCLMLSASCYPDVQP
jgi:hypothetical protein